MVSVGVNLIEGKRRFGLVKNSVCKKVSYLLLSCDNHNHSLRVRGFISEFGNPAEYSESLTTEQESQDKIPLKSGL